MEKSKNNIPRYIIIGALLIIFLIAFCIRYVSFIWNNENDNLLKYEVDTNKKNAIIINNKINGIGSRFPITQIGSACRYGTFSSDAANRPPLSSRIGSSEIMKITACSEMYGDRF